MHALSGLFPDCARLVVAERLLAPDESTLFPDEAAAIQAAVPSRRREFVIGRWCARQALAALGVATSTIPVGRQRAPIWPPGVVGSITHCKGFIAAVVAPADQLRAIGFDAEPAVPLDADLVSLICTDDDRAWIDAQSEPPAAGWPKVVFSAKESIHKCIAPLFGRTLDFLDVTLTLNARGDTFSVRSANPPATAGIDLAAIRGRIAVTDGLVVTAAVVPR